MSSYATLRKCLDLDVTKWSMQAGGLAVYSLYVLFAGVSFNGACST